MPKKKAAKDSENRKFNLLKIKTRRLFLHFVSHNKIDSENGLKGKLDEYQVGFRKGRLTIDQFFYV